MMTEAKEKKPLLLKKWLLLELALNDKRLAKGDCAVNWQILDRYNPDKGVAYPSLKRLATDTGFTQRNTQRSITKLVNADYVHIIQHGNQSRTNRYRPNFSLLDRVETATSLPNEGVETATSLCRDGEVLNVETATSLEPTYEPAYKTRGELSRKISNEIFDATPPLPLTGASLASSKSKSQYQDFWMIYPKRMNVSKAEIEITEALNDGALLDDILDGARRYANYVKHQGWCGDHKYISLPHNWIKGKRWLDDWTVSPKDKIKVEFETEAQPTKKTTVKDAPQSKVKTAAYIEYIKQKAALRKKQRDADNKSNGLWAEIGNHFTGCNDCTVKDGVKADIVTDYTADGYNLESDNVVFCGAAKSILQARKKADDAHSNACDAYDDFKSKKAPPKFAVKDAPRPAKQKSKATPAKAKPEAVIKPEKPKRALTYKHQKQAAFDVYYKQRRECDKNNPECKSPVFCPTCNKNKELWQSF